MVTCGRVQIRTASTHLAPKDKRPAPYSHINGRAKVFVIARLASRPATDSQRSAFTSM